MSTTTKKKSGKKSVFIIIGIVLAVFIIAIIGISAVLNNLIKNAGLTVDAAHPVYQDISSDVTTSGTISSANITTYTGAINATINDVNIKPGQTIKKGDLLLTYDTASLEDQYNEAFLTARSSRLTNQATVDASNKTSADITQAQQKADSLKSQIAAIQAEITNLRNTDTGEDPNQDLTASLAEKRTRLDAVLNEIQTILDTKPAAEDLAKNQDYINKCNERDTLTASIANLEAILKTLPDNSTSIMAAIEAKNAELSDLQTQLSQQEATIDSAQAGLLTSTQKEQINVSNQLANMQVEAAATSLEEGRQGIVAEQDGIITSVEVTKGSATATGTPLFTIADDSQMKVTVPLSKKDLAAVALNQKATITVLDHTYEGTVTYISRIATTGANGATNIDAEVTISNPDENLVLGLDAKVVIHTASVTNVLSIPNLAVNVDTTGSFVYAVDNGIVTKKYIETGVSDVNNCQILSGLTTDDIVITNVSAGIEEGLPAIPNIADPAESDAATPANSDVKPDASSDDSRSN